MSYKAFVLTDDVVECFRLTAGLVPQVGRRDPTSQNQELRLRQVHQPDSGPHLRARRRNHLLKVYRIKYLIDVRRLVACLVLGIGLMLGLQIISL